MGAQILIVEDDWTLAEGLRAALEFLGYGVAGVAPSGAEAIAVAGRAAPDLALMDVHLQGPMDGIEAAGILRERFRVPVVYLTSHFDDATLARARLTMPYGYLAKPFDERELRSTVEIALYKHALDARIAVAGRLAALGTLAAGLGHEINNPLTYVLGNVDFALDVLRRHGFTGDGAGPERDASPALDGDLREVAAVLAEARQGALRVRDTVRSVKHFARVEEAATARVEVREPLEEALRMTGVELRDRARVRVEYGATPAVMADPARLQQVFVNLLLNASQAVAEGATARSEVSVRTSTDARGHAVVEVRDTGRGIAPADLPRVFEPFFTTRPVGGGAGLGLAVCHGVVAALGGEITVESELGRGAVARVTLPPAPAAEAPPAPGVPASEPARRGRVLVIDDEDAVARSIARMLRAAHDVVVETDPRDALARIDAGEPFDLVLCDLMMPAMSGIELFEALAAAHPSVAARVVFITGGAVSQRAREFLARQARPHLAKPFSAESLRRVAADAVREPTER